MELIASLDNQTYKAAQVILVDDCSPLAWYKSSVTGQSEDGLVKLPENIRLVRRPKNHGPAAARSLGLGLAMAEHQAQVNISLFLCLNYEGGQIPKSSNTLLAMLSTNALPCTPDRQFH